MEDAMKAYRRICYHTLKPDKDEAIHSNPVHRRTRIVTKDTTLWLSRFVAAEKSEADAAKGLVEYCPIIASKMQL